MVLHVWPWVGGVGDRAGPRGWPCRGVAWVAVGLACSTMCEPSVEERKDLVGDPASRGAS